MHIKILAIILFFLSETVSSQEIFPFKKDDLWGYMDTTGKIVIEPQFPMAGFFTEGLAYVQLDGALGYIDESGLEVISAEYPAATNFHEGFASVMIDEDWMIINKDGELAMDSYFANPVTFNNGLAKFKLEMGLRSKYGFINTYGDTAIYPEFEFVSDFSNGLCMASTDGSKYGYINVTGEWVIQPEYELGALLKINDEYVFKEKDFSNGYVAVQKGDLYGLIDITGAQVLDFKFEFLGQYGEGLIPARKGTKFGYVNLKGKWIVKPKYSGAEKFNNGLAAVSKGSIMDSKWGFIDHSGKVVIPITIYSYFSMYEPIRFWDGFVPCYIEADVFGYVDRKGKVIWKIE